MRRLVYLLATVACVACGTPDHLKVMTFNMRYDNPEDGENNWQNRRERVAEAIASRDADVVGAQELLANQFDDMKGLLPGYQAVGVGRVDGAREGEFNAVFFKKDRFELLSTGNFWLSETPEVVGSKGWDGACERLATWVVLRDGSGKEFLFVNTHLDHVGEMARREGVSLLVHRIDSMRQGRPVILTGDFNAEPESDVITHVVESGILHHAKDIAAVKAGPDWSFTDFGRIPVADRSLIDYIFCTEGLRTQRYEVLPDTLQGGFLSDHAPIMAEFEFEK